MNKTVFFKTFRRLFGFVLAISLSASVLTAQAQNARITLNLSDAIFLSTKVSTPVKSSQSI